MRPKLLVLGTLKLLGLFALARLKNRQRVRILCYHGAWLANDGYTGDAMFIRPATFAKHLHLLHHHGFQVISLDRAVAGLSGRCALPPDSVVITLDDGWYSTYAEMLPLLRKMQMPATIYCDTANLIRGMAVPHVMARYLRTIHGKGRSLSREAETSFRDAVDLDLDEAARHTAMLKFAAQLGIRVDGYIRERVFNYMTPSELAASQAEGFSIELHTHRHRMHGFQPSKVAEEINENRRVLSILLDKAPGSFAHFCYPSGEISPGIDAVLADLQIASATTLQSGFADRDTNPRLLPRLTAGEGLSTLEFEAELCGVGDLLRRLLRWTLAPLRVPATVGPFEPVGSQADLEPRQWH